MTVLCECPGTPDSTNLQSSASCLRGGISKLSQYFAKEQRYWGWDRFVVTQVEQFANMDPKLSWETRDTYGPPGISLNFSLSGILLISVGFRGIFTNHYVALCAAFSALGGFLFGYEYAHFNGFKMCTSANCS
jgi:hypothetical protein